MASVFEEGLEGGFPFFIAGVSLLFACCVALCAACKRKDEGKLPSQDNEQVVYDEPAVPGPTAPVAFGGSLPNLQHGSGRDPGDANITPAPLSLSHPPNKDDMVGSCSFLALPQRDLPNVLFSPDMTYSNLSFPKRGEVVTLCESQKVEGEESQNVHPAADKIVENIPGHQAEAGGPSYACVVKKKKKTDGKQTWVEVDQPQEMSLLTSTALSLPKKEIEEMYSVVRKEKKKKKKAQRSEEAAPQAKEMMVSQESNGIASYQSSSLPTATEPYYDTVPCEAWTKVASQPAAEPAYESVDSYWDKAKKKTKAPKKKMAPENLYESIDQVAIYSQQGQGRTSQLES